ncbi:hypothetical protein PoB_000634600 [Plakobranchus ocellatus]|uniref:Uncharacterized protein n=1 Tax=Plakobranchus ocellatus TaxID=259542 RepID=A0AAV3YBT9_9GAST|nr:hypothetical protein PoB_000634600 [Plakobranchus ocellatus]
MRKEEEKEEEEDERPGLTGVSVGSKTVVVVLFECAPRAGTISQGEGRRRDKKLMNDGEREKLRQRQIKKKIQLTGERGKYFSLIPMGDGRNPKAHW